MKPRQFVDRYRKDPRFIVTVPLLVLTATSLIYYAIQKAKELSPEALTSKMMLFVLWNINVLLILGIVFVILRGVAKLVLERQRGIIGSRFRTKLVATYMLMSLVPVGVLFFVLMDLLRVSVDRWFNTPVRKILQNGEAIAQMAQDQSAAKRYPALEAGDTRRDRSLDRRRRSQSRAAVPHHRHGGRVPRWCDAAGSRKPARADSGGVRAAP